MANAIESQGTTLEIGTGSGSAATITGVTLGAITKITSTSHGLAEGDVVTLASIGGTTGLNSLTPMVIATETNAFYIDVDSSAMSAYTSVGTATPVTWTEIGEVTDWDGPGGSASVITKTTLASDAVEKLLGLPDEGQFNLSVNFYPDDLGQTACRAARAARTEKDFRITYTDDTVQTFKGYVSTFSSSGGVDGLVSGSVGIEISGAVSTT
jgi:hypothetical protein